MLSRAEYEELLEERKHLQRQVRNFEPSYPIPLSQQEFEQSQSEVDEINKVIDRLNETADEIEEYREQFNQLIDEYTR